MTRRASQHYALVYIEKFDKKMKRRLNFGTGRKDKKKVLAFYLRGE